MEQQLLWNKRSYQRIIVLKKIIIIFFVSFSFIGLFSQESKEEGLLFIYFREEKVGFEEYSWESSQKGFLLRASGQMTKPIALEIDSMSIRLNKSYIPLEFYFKGSVSGVKEEIRSFFFEGEAEITTLVSGKERKTTASIRRDAFLLPNAIYSPYVVITKKFCCQLQQKLELSAYIIPQLEVPFTLESKEEAPCILVMDRKGMEIELETDEQGRLKSLAIPSQRLRIISGLE